MTAKLTRSPLSRALALALLALAAACDGSSSSSPPEAPRSRLSGELRAAPGGAPESELRLALAWYPGLVSGGAPISQPGAIQTQDVAYGGALPHAYAFDLVDAPPASALRPLPDGYAGEGAVGILLAYEDRNGNRRLDTIPASGPPVDAVLGVSLEWTTSPSFAVVYLTDDQPSATGLRAGFNLVRITDAETSEVVPLATPVPVPISAGGPRLDLFVCEDAWDGSGSQAPCGLDLSDPQVLDAELQGEIYATPTTGEAAFALLELVDGQPVRITDAAVTLDGVEIPFDPESGYYWHGALDPAMFAEERSVALVARRGGAELRRWIAIPAFDFTRVPASVVSGADFDVSWSVPRSAPSFNLFLFADDFFLNVYGLEGPRYHVLGAHHVGEARLTIAAIAQGEVSVTVVRTTTLVFEEAPAAVRRAATGG